MHKLSGLPALFTLAALCTNMRAEQSRLQVEYGSAGVQTVTYDGFRLADASQDPTGAFHIWHMKATDTEGKLLKGGQYDWGENNSGKTWDPATHTWLYKFNWGSITVHFSQSGNNLDLNIQVTNFATSKTVFEGATIYPLVLHFPALPDGFKDSSYPQLGSNTAGPSVIVADVQKVEVVSVNPTAGQPLYSGFFPTSAVNAYTTIVSSTSIDGMPTFYPRFDRPVPPGKSDTYTVSLRFAAAKTPIADVAADAYASWKKTWPPKLQWSDRRIIGTVYLASSPAGDANSPAGYPLNPRRYFNDANMDVLTTSGLVKFQKRVLRQAAINVENLKRLNAQGAITWDIEGEEYPQTTSYVCEPDQIAQESPEMESLVREASSTYRGMKLDDAYFKTIRDAGFRVGVCVRPQHFQKNEDGTASQVLLPDSQVRAELIRKMKYAHDRWGATLFYMDSTVDANGAALNADIFNEVEAALPDSLLIPEESTAKYYAYTAPFQTFLFHGDLGTPTDVATYYPNAFSANLINDVDPAKLAEHERDLVASVRRGDLLMVHADYWQANNSTVLEIYRQAQSENKESR